ncbi:MAG: Asp-tRNA(Asn)/Glu-tRNA(Gln) amidotransferase subunit GatC [Planctomycetota bacterium]|nr:Asp-tRNA(Asn)/Glu-tRNA(Gln) amidotransferase subunit GatC [Planctomycetota bacterium]MDA1262007.1 Asp-tRNA(Asn)/Glu-tRNA(Gln) amidotransferase subunit GatC [Planctomycetota bacterium]
MSDQPAPLTIEDVRHVAKLARLAVPQERLASFQHDLQAILGHIAQLQSVNTDGLEPMAHPLTLTNRLGDDIPQSSMPIADLLRNAPAVEGDFLAVPKVLGGESS